MIGELFSPLKFALMLGVQISGNFAYRYLELSQYKCICCVSKNNKEKSELGSRKQHMLTYHTSMNSLDSLCIAFEDVTNYFHKIANSPQKFWNCLLFMKSNVNEYFAPSNSIILMICVQNVV